MTETFGHSALSRLSREMGKFCVGTCRQDLAQKGERGQAPPVQAARRLESVNRIDRLLRELEDNLLAAGPRDQMVDFFSCNARFADQSTKLLRQVPLVIPNPL